MDAGFGHLIVWEVAGEQYHPNRLNKMPKLKHSWRGAHNHQSKPRLSFSNKILRSKCPECSGLLEEAQKEE